MSITNSLLATLLFFVVLFPTTPSVQAQQDKAKLKVGAILPLTGSLATFGKDLQQGADLALSDLKEEDPDLASRIELIVKDYESVSTKASTLAKELLASRQADILIGPVTGSTTITVFRALEGDQHPMISATATQSEITKLGEHVFRSSLVDPFQGKLLASFASAELRKSKAVILLDEASQYATSIANAFEQDFKALGGQVVGRVAYQPNSADFSREISKVRAKGPQVVLLPGYYKDAAKIIDQARAMGLKVPFLGSDGWDSPKLYRLAAKESLKGHYYVSHFNADDQEPSVKDFVRKFQQRFQRAPTTFAAMGYDSISLIADSFKRAHTNLPNSLTRALASAQNVRGVMGPISMTNNRDALKSAVIVATSPEGPKFKLRLRIMAAASTTQKTGVQ